MSDTTTYGDVTVAIGEDFVAEVEIHRPPNNYFDANLIASLSDAYEALDDLVGMGINPEAPGLVALRRLLEE